MLKLYIGFPSRYSIYFMASWFQTLHYTELTGNTPGGLKIVSLRKIKEEDRVLLPSDLSHLVNWSLLLMGDWNWRAVMERKAHGLIQINTVLCVLNAIPWQKEFMQFFSIMGSQVKVLGWTCLCSLHSWDWHYCKMSNSWNVRCENGKWVKRNAKKLSV